MQRKPQETKQLVEKSDVSSLEHKRSRAAELELENADKIPIWQIR